MALEHKITHILNVSLDGRIMRVSYLTKGSKGTYALDNGSNFCYEQEFVNINLQKGNISELAEPITISPVQGLFIDGNGNYFVADKHLLDEDPNLKQLEFKTRDLQIV